MISDKEAIENLPQGEDRKYFLVSQTTFQLKKFEDLVDVFKEKEYNYDVVNTICNATAVRQEEAYKIASSVDAMIVIGGRNSSNTQKLYDICKGECNNTYYIQTLQDFDFPKDNDFGTVGITAGASTPKKIIKEVQDYVRTKL